MRKLNVFINLSLDGVMQAPGRSDEDPRGGFPYGGWAAPYQAMASGMGEERPPEPTPLLFGRRTYEDFYGFWPKQGPNPYTEVLTKAPKYVASTTLKEPLPWENSFLLQGDVPQAVAHLKTLEGPNLLIMGSGVLVQSLMKHNLVDRYVFLIHPLVLGTGRKLFEEGLPHTELRLVESKTTPNGVIIATYEP